MAGLALEPLAGDVRLGAPVLRWGLLLVGLAWSLLAWRGRRGPALLGGTLFVVAVLGFWGLSFGRPYGLATASAVSREAAFAVRAALSPALDGFVAGQPFAGGRWARLAGLGVPLELLLAAPTWLPLLVVPASAWLVAWLWRSPAATWGAVLWLAFSTSDLEALAGGGFVDGLWAHPAGSLAFLAAAAGALLLGRGGRAAVPGAAALALGAWLALPAAQPAPGLEGLGLALVVHCWPWPLLALLGSTSRTDAAARWCLGLGLLGCLAASAGLPLDDWSARALWRLGLVLSAAPGLQRCLTPLAERLCGARLRPAPGAGLALLLAVALPGSFLAWWSPYQHDTVAEASHTPVPQAVRVTGQWLSEQLPAGAVVVASETYAPMVAVLGGARVLRAPGLERPADDARRSRLESALLGRGEQGRENARRYGVTHVLVGPGDAGLWGLDGAGLPGRLRPLAAPAPGFTVYALEGW